MVDSQTFEDSLPCPDCGFVLWNPIGRLTSSWVGLYDDSRFPGRLIITLRSHFDHFDEVPEELMEAFVRDVQRAAQELRKTLGADRVNIAILGNQESHVHAHVIPRMCMNEPLPQQSPWADPRPRGVLDRATRDKILSTLAGAFID